MRVEGHIRVFADFDRTQALTETQLLGGIERHQTQGRHRIHALVAHALGGLEHQASNHLVAVRVQRRQHARALHQRGVVRDAVVGLDLVGPPITKGGTCNACCGHFRGHFVALEHMLQRGDGVAMTLSGTQQHHNLIRTIAVRVHQNRLVKHF